MLKKLNNFKSLKSIQNKSKLLITLKKAQTHSRQLAQMGSKIAQNTLKLLKFLKGSKSLEMLKRGKDVLKSLKMLKRAQKYAK